MQRKLFDLAYSINLLGNEGTTFTNGAEKAVKWKAEMESLKARANTNLAKYPQLLQSLDKYWNPPRRAAAPPPPVAAAAADVPAPAAAAAQPPPRPGAPSTDPYMNAVFEAAQHVDASDATYTWIVYSPGEVRDMPVLRAGNVAAPGEVVPRGFPAVLANGADTTFKQGSGRLELADRIFTDARALAARVMVNRVWGWHFGKGLVATASDFGTQGDKPTHPELLDDLAARFIANGWSLKWLNKEIMMSAAYRQSSQPRADGLQADEGNALLWRQNPQRLDAEAYRDTLTRSAGLLDVQIGGLPGDIDEDTFYRRAIYGRVSRARRSQMLGLFDFPEATQSAPGRDITTSTLQQIYVMNSAFMQNLAEAAAKTAAAATGEAEQIGVLYRRILARDPNAAELKHALTYLQKRHVAALRADSALDQRGDFSAMKIKLSRREMLESLGGGLGLFGLAGAFAGLSRGEVHAAGLGNYAGPALPVKAKHVIMLYLNGGPSQIDMFDPKPALFKYAGQRPSAVDLRTERTTGGLLPSPFEFKRYGRNGVEVSELLPQLASVVDDMCVIRSMYTFNPTHTPARALLHTGSVLATRPSTGSWITYGLGTENQNLPAFVALASPGGPMTRSGFLPSEYQGVAFPVNDPDPEKIIPNLRNKNVDSAAQRTDMDALLELNQSYTKSFGADQFLEGRIKSMETAYRMQFEALDLFDIRKEPQNIRDEYGPTPFGNGCLLARRLVEAGVRYSQRRLSRRADLGRSPRRQRQPSQALPRHGPGLGGADPRPEAPRVARRNAGRVGRRIRPHAGIGKRLGPRPQPVRIHDVRGRRRVQGRHCLRRDRRVRLQGRGESRIHSRPACHAAASARHGPHTVDLSLRGPGFPS